MAAGVELVAPSRTDVEVHAGQVRAGQVRALAEILRSMLIAALACGLLGTIVGGLGGRMVMRLAALLNPTSIGLATENGNRIGDITLGGTFALVMFGGLFPGLVGAVVWVTVAGWMPDGRVVRAVATAALAVALGGTILIDSFNPDFALLDPDLPIVVMLLAIPAIFGLLLPSVIRWLDGRVRHPGADPTGYTLLTGAFVLLGGIPFVPIAIGFTFDADRCLCSVAPVPLGVPLVVAGLATLATWIATVRGWVSPPAVAITGRAGVLVAAVLGLAILIREIDRIPG